MNTDSLTEAFYSLFVAEYGLELDLTGLAPRDNLRNTPASLALLFTNDSFRVVLHSQPISLIEMSFEQRFAHAIDSIGWPADAFLALLHHSDSFELARKASVCGKTALHWAAAHLGVWLRRSGWPQPHRPFSEKIEGYGKLVSWLVRMGADVYALYSTESQWAAEIWGPREKDPFLVFLEGVETDHTYYWNSEALYDAVSRWGELLLEGGLDLPDYVIAENKFLQSVRYGDMKDLQDKSPWSEGHVFQPVELSLSSESALTLEVREVPYFHIWTSTPDGIPGAWPKSSSSHDIIIWIPGQSDERDGSRWVDTGVKFMETRPKRVETDKMTSDSRTTHCWAAYARVSDLQTTQDDHGLVATLIRREHRAQNEAPRRRRASSASALPGIPMPHEMLWSQHRDTI
jgi:hypothetical protein